MKESISELRAAESTYSRAKQRRYDELVDWGPYDADALEKHKKVMRQIRFEERAVIVDDIQDTLMCTCTSIMDRGGKLYDGSRVLMKEFRQPE